MEWYYIVAIIVGFLLIVFLLAYLGAKGAVNRGSVSLISSIVSGTATAIGAISGSTDSKPIAVFSLIMQLVDKAVKAAQNAFYNDEIPSDRREEVCMSELNDLLVAANIVLTDAQLAVIKTLIKASCEELGHGAVAAKDTKI